MSYKKYILLNYCSTIISGVCGIFIPILVGIFYPIDILGVFNQACALYLVLAQLAAFGIHLSILKHTAQFTGHQDCQIEIISSGFIATIMTALPCATLIYFLSDFFALIFNSANIAIAIPWVAIGVFLFALNKALLAVLNALELLIAYATYTSLRYILLMLFLGIYITLDIYPYYLIIIFPLAEGILCIALVHRLRKYIILSAIKYSTFCQHISFGLRAMGGNFLLELNTRIDIICLGIFLDDAIVGIYSMIAILAEGAYQLPIVLRTVYNTKIVQLLEENNFALLQNLCFKIRNVTWLAMLTVSLLSVLLYPHVIEWITKQVAYTQAQVPFAILLFGVSFVSGYVPYSFLLINAGYPGRHSYMIFLVLLVNITCNLALIPLWGIYGAAIGTSISYIAFVILLRFFAKKYVLLCI